MPLRCPLTAVLTFASLLTITASAGDPAPLDLTGSSLMETENGRYVLQYAIECALPAGAEATASYRGELYRFSGGMGIAPDWTERALSDEERAAVSACLLARTNAFGVSVRISLRSQSVALADLPAFQADDDERAHYDLWEGRFFGDILDDDPRAFACRGDTTPDTEAALRDLLRVCTLPATTSGTSSPPVSLCGFRVFASCDLPEARTALDQFGNVAVDVYLPGPTNP